MGFVGRERELGVLGAALERAAAGRLSRVVVTGPTGVGVSRLLDEIERRLEGEPGLVVARGTACEPCSGVPFAAVAEALRGPLGSLADDELREVAGAAAPELALLLPELRARLDAAGAITGVQLEPASDQRGSRVVEAVLGLLGRLARGGTVLLALDDLQDADPGTRSFVEALLRVTLPLPLCLVVAYHSDEVPRTHPFGRLRDLLSDRALVDTIHLEPFSREEVLAFVERRIGERPSAGLVAAILERSHGNPLVAEQLLAARRSVPALRLSDTFEEILQARLGAMSAQAVRCLRVLAALRRPFRHEVVVRLDVGDGRLSVGGMREAIDSGLAVERGDRVVIGQGVYAEAIEGLLDPARRQDIHARLASSLETAPAERAWHLERAMLLAAACRAHVEAGEAAEALDPGGTALEHHLRALELNTAGDRPGRAYVLAKAAQAAFVVGQFRRAANLASLAIDERAAAGAGVPGGLESAADDCVAGPGPDLALLHERLGRYRWAAGDVDPALAAFRTAVQLSPAEPSADRARVLAALAQALMLDGRYEESTTAARRAVEVARVVGHAALGELGHATCTLAVDMAYSGDLAGGLELLREAAAVARRAGRLDELMRVYANQTTLLDLDSRREEALTVVEEGIAEARRWGQEAVYGAFLRGNAADCLFVLGRWAESEAMCRQALEWSPTGMAWFNPLVGLALVRVESAADDEAGRVLGQLLLQLETVPDMQWSATVMRAMVSHALWREDLADARRAVDWGWERVLRGDDWVQVVQAAATAVEVAAALAEAARARRDAPAIAAAATMADDIIHVAEHRLAVCGAPPALGARREADLHLATARAHRDRLHGQTNADAWEGIARAWSATPVPYRAAHARRWEAEAVLRTRPGHAGGRADRARAGRALGEAWSIAVALGARPLQRELTRLAARARMQLPVIAAAEAVRVAGGGAAGPSAELTDPGWRPGVADLRTAGPARVVEPTWPGDQPMSPLDDRVRVEAPAQLRQARPTDAELAAAAAPTGRREPDARPTAALPPGSEGDPRGVPAVGVENGTAYAGVAYPGAEVDTGVPWLHVTVTPWQPGRGAALPAVPPAPSAATGRAGESRPPDDVPRTAVSGQPPGVPASPSAFLAFSDSAERLAPPADDARGRDNRAARGGRDRATADPRTADAGHGFVDRLSSGHAASVTDPFRLSPRETEVLGVLAEGRTNREIAHRLYISERTVAVHVGNILAKLGVSGRVEAATVALRLGLVGPEVGLPPIPRPAAAPGDPPMAPHGTAASPRIPGRPLPRRVMPTDPSGRRLPGARTGPPAPPSPGRGFRNPPRPRPPF